MSIFGWIMKTFFGAGAENGSPDTEDTSADAAPASNDSPTARQAAVPSQGTSQPPVPSTEDASPVQSPRADPSQVRILLAPFQNDREGQFTQRFADSLKTGQFIDLQQIDDAPSVPAKPLTTKQAGALFGEAAGRLARSDADLLILGTLSKAGLALFFLPSAPPPEARPDCFGLGDSLTVSPNFDADTANLIYASVLCAVLPMKNQVARNLSPALVAAAETAMPLLKADTGERAPAEIASIMTHLGVVAANVWRLSGKSGGLVSAIAGFRRALAEGPKEVTALSLAELKIRLAAALKELAAVQDDLDRYEEAADILESVAGVLNRSTHQREWGLAYKALGDVLLLRGQKVAEAGDCKNAVTAYDAALQVFTKETDAARWSDVMSQRGAAHMIWGALGAGTIELAQAVATYREVLAQRSQATEPLHWALASNNLGTAAFALAKRTRDGDLMREATVSFDGALAIYQKHGQSQSAEIVRKKIQRVERLQAPGSE